MHRIVAHWTDDNTIKKHQHQRQCEHKIEQKRKKKRYRRLWFYFFEKEIRQDIYDEVVMSDSRGFSENLRNAEYGSLIARSAFVLDNNNYEVWDACTVVVNDYLFGQGDFFEKNYDDADQMILDVFASQKHFQ